MSAAVTRSERIRLRLLFGLFGLGLMAIAPRAVDLKHNLGVANGLYGLLVSLGAVGSVISLLVMGRLVQRVGVRATLYVSATTLYGLMALIPHIHTPSIYAILNILLALSFSSHNLALHTQTLQRQDESGEMLLPGMHGSWSIGSLLTVVLALVLTSRVSFAWHIDILMAIVWVLTMFLIRSSHSTFVRKSMNLEPAPPINFARFKSIFTFDKSVVVAFALGTLIEFASGDWSTLVTNQEIHAKKSVAIFSYFALVIAMIIGRMSFVRLIGFRSERFWIRTGALVGGGGFLFFSQLAYFLAGRGHSIAIVLEILAFFIAGLGTSFMSPLVTTIANRRSSLKPSEVVSQLNLSNTIIAFGSKLIVAWVAQATSITVALILPAIALMLMSRLAYLGNPHRIISEKN